MANGLPEIQIKLLGVFMLLFTTALTTFSSVQFFEGAVAAIALYVSTKPAIKRPRTTRK